MSDGAPELVRGVVVAHAELAEALVAAVESIAAPDEGSLVAISNRGRGPDAIGEAILEAVGAGPAIIFSDLPVGSCGLAARRVCRDQGPYAMICGANLAILLDFVTHRDMPLSALVDRLVERGHTSISCVPTTASGHVGGPVSR